ncbi:hypothetical protein OTU49_014816 [Cherax quadricarinatus]|uniref:Uncharacterized protein n=1 Tax=Cherax quadricarinatus TaxID=27406 RepID=A0AAW0Y4U8_CHEQU
MTCELAAMLSPPGRSCHSPDTRSRLPMLRAPPNRGWGRPSPSPAGRPLRPHLPAPHLSSHALRRMQESPSHMLATQVLVLVLSVYFNFCTDSQLRLLVLSHACRIIVDGGSQLPSYNSQPHSQAHTLHSLAPGAHTLAGAHSGPRAAAPLLL